MKTFSGSYFEIGKQQGKIYKNNGMSFEHIKIDKALFENQLKIYKKYYPELIEELKGLAEGGNYDKDKVIYRFLTSELLWYKSEFRLNKACTIFGVKNKNGVFVGRNYDWIDITAKVFETYKYKILKKNSFIGITDMAVGSKEWAHPKYLFYNADDAINDKGLFIGITFAFNNKWNYGISTIHMTRLIAESCSTVQEALNIFKKVPVAVPKNFFIADKKGNMAVVEHSSKRFKVRYPKDNLLVLTNNYVELKKEDRVLMEVPSHNTYNRYDEILDKVNVKNFNYGDVSKILTNPKLRVCQNFKDFKTIWTIALDMKNSKYKLYWDLFDKKRTKELKF